MRLQFHLGSNHSAVQQERTLQSERGGAESSCRLYPALPEDYIFTSQESQKHLPTQLILSVDFITLEKKLLSMLWSYPASNEVFKLKTLSSEWVPGRQTVCFSLLHLCLLQLFPRNPVPFFVLKSFVTQSYKIALIFYAFVHSRNNGMTVKKFIQFGENCSHSRLLTQVSALFINLNENIKLAGWISSKELHLLAKNNEVILDHSIPMKDEWCLRKGNLEVRGLNHYTRDDRSVMVDAFQFFARKSFSVTEILTVSLNSNRCFIIFL